MAEVERDVKVSECEDADVQPKDKVDVHPCYTQNQKKHEEDMEKRRGIKASHCLQWSGLHHEEQPYLEISEHGLIGNLHSCALVGVGGAVAKCG